MPYAEPVVLEGREYELRHIGPVADIFPSGELAEGAVTPIGMTPVVLLNRTDMVGYKLPMANQPNSTDFVQGSWTARLGDAGEMQLTFPNKEGSDGLFWRDRFDPTGRLQWIEIRYAGYLEQVCCIEKVEVKRDQVTVTGHDGFFQLKSAYERDWTVTRSPRDVIERGTQVWVPTTVDEFPMGTLNAQWTTSGTVGIANSGGCVLHTNSSITSPAVSVPSTSAWRALLSVNQSVLDTGLTFNVVESSGNSYAIVVDPSSNEPCVFFINGLTNVGIFVPSFGAIKSAYSLLIESDGEWVAAYINGALIAQVRRTSTSTTSLYVIVAEGGSVSTSVLGGVLVEALQPFLQRGTDKGDYVLPGTVSTYPSGGLHARYSNNTDIAADPNMLVKIHAPTRLIAANGSSQPGEYQDQQDATINHALSGTGFAPQPGSTDAGFSAIWFGAIYLKLGTLVGSYSFRFSVDDGVRIWIGKTQWGDQIIDSWISQAVTDYTATIACGSGSSLAGRDSQGNLVARDGWYPIKIEYFNNTSNNAAIFQFTPPQGYTDPGGTALTGGAQVVVPGTSLSPLGCVDERYQGISHFDIVQKTTAAFGYQIACGPRSLESQLFPGVLAPRIREGQDYDVVLEPDDDMRKEGLLNYSNTLDGTDVCTSLWGNGAGLQSGDVGQLQETVYDPNHLTQALFDVQGWQDFSDASYPSLLQALLNSLLGLRLDPWQLVSGDPIGRPRQAFSWPLPGSLSQLRWRPGDGMRIRAIDVALNDTVPRQLLTMSRQIHPNAILSSQVGFAARPRDREYVLKQQIYTVSRWQRNYQRTLVALTGNYLSTQSMPAGSTTRTSGIAILPNDTLVHAYLRLLWRADGVNVWKIITNTVDVTATLLGASTFSDANLPMTIDLMAVAQTQAGVGAGGLYVSLKNTDSVAHNSPEIQLFVEVQR